MSKKPKLSSYGVSDAQMDKLTAKQQLFVMEVGNDKNFNLSRAAKRAGYSSGSATNNLLKNKSVRHAIGSRLYHRAWEAGVNSDRVIRELMTVAFANPKEVVDEDNELKPLSDLPNEVARSISSITINEKTGCVTYKFWNKLDALNMIMKHLGMGDQRLQVQHDVGPNATDLLGRMLEAAEGHRNVIDSKVIEEVLDSNVILDT